MLKKFVCLVIFSFLFISTVFAGGGRDITEKESESLESWQETFDISEKKPGKYNIMVTAKDKGGNVQVTGPYNITIDPNSDLPVVGITNPISNMRVSGNLNIVGTGIDDDAMDKVLLILDGDEENPIVAEGSDYWSYYLDTTNLEEGPHTVLAYGIDVNGVQGNSVLTTWHLDRRQPLTEVQNYAQGPLVSGKVTLKGQITDGNGIASLEYSTDGGQTYLPTKIIENKKTGEYFFEFDVDTRPMEDGAAVIWFRAKDLQGSSGLSSFLFFVDNTKPVVELLYPISGQYVNGIFSVAGTAKDVIGITSLSWQFNEQSGSFDVVAGNPYWAVELDVRNIEKKELPLFITAQDTVGNITTQKFNILIDSSLDLPSTNITYPVANSIISGTKESFYIRGFASDDDGIAQVVYSVDGGAEQTVDCQAAFYIDLSDIISDSVLSAGTHTVKMYAVDIHGIKGNSQEISFVSQGAAPSVENGVISSKNGNQDYSFGMEIHPELDSVFKTVLHSDCGLKFAEWTVNDVVVGNITPKNPEKNIPVEIDLGANSPWGVVRLGVSAVDIYDRQIQKEWLVYLTNLTKIIPLIETGFSMEDLKSKAVFTDTQKINFLSIDNQPYKAGVILSLPRNTLKEEEKFVSIRIQSETPVTSVAYTIQGAVDNGAVIGGDASQTGKATIKKTEDPTIFDVEIPLKNLPVRWTVLEVTAAGKTGVIAKDSAVFGIVRGKDATEIQDEEKMYWGKNHADSNGSYKFVEGFFNLKTPIAANLSVIDSNLDFVSKDKIVTITALKDGVYNNLVVSAKDGYGRNYQSTESQIVYSESAPVISLDLPENGSWVQNALTVEGKVVDANGIKLIEISLDGENTWIPVDMSITKDSVSSEGILQKEFSVPLPMHNYADGFIPVDVRITDSLGISSVVRSAIQKDTQAPSVQVITPAPGDLVNGETLVTVLIQDAGLLTGSSYIPPTSMLGSVVQTTSKSAEDGVETVSDAVIEEQNLDLKSLVTFFAGRTTSPLDAEMGFSATDVAGNTLRFYGWDFKIDAESDKPRTEIHLPEENAIITSDFTVSGVIYDDDGESRIFYKIDDGEFIQVEEFGSSFAIDLKINDLGDNEHTITIFAEDIHGVRGDSVSRNFRISLEEPKGAVSTPSLEETVKGVVKMTGVSSDKNGIALVQISVDNGNSFNDAIGTENWEYELDTRVIQDGTHVVFLRIYDNYGISALYTSLINIDNTVPEIALELPMDDSSTSGMLFFSGQTMDNIKLQELYITIRPLDNKNSTAMPPHLNKIELIPDNIITKAVDISALQDGFYNIELTGADAGGNTRRVSRNIKLDKNLQATKVDLMYPLNGEHVQGVFNVYGTASSESPIEKLMLYVDDVFVAETNLSSSGYYKFELTPELISAGTHNLTVKALTANSSMTSSNVQYVVYKPEGAWVSIDNFTMCDFAVDRPFLEGRAGYVFSEEDLLLSQSKEATKEQKQAIAEKTVEKIEFSFDNGKTFTQVGEKGMWSYRIENEDMREGYHFLFVRATMKNGETAITRSIIRIDKTSPIIKLISPGIGGAFNNELVFSGLSSDDVGLDSVNFTLRSGDKSSYEVPAFIQGLYFDVHFWGATLYDVGMGLTFFDDNVKLQFQFGQFTQEQRALFDKSGFDMRYGGNVIGMKLLANIAYIPMRYFWGPDWSWLSAGFALGANFSLFTQTQSGRPQMLSAMLGQVEFPRITLEERKMFTTFSFYIEGQLWFIPTDVQGGSINISPVIPQISGGIRVNVF